MPPPATSARPREAGRRIAPRKRKRSPSEERRKLRRALKRAVRTSTEIQGAARKRQRSRAAGESNAAASLDTDLDGLYGAFGDDKRAIFATGQVPNGAPYKGRTWRAS